MQRKKQSLFQKIGSGLVVIATLLIALLFLPLIAFILVLHFLRRAVLHILIWFYWIRSGKDILFVYSDSPIWREYMVDEVLPAIEERAIILNWSERKQWPKRSLSKSVFSAFRGERDWNPMVLVFRPFRKPRTFRFFGPFKSWKQGNSGQVERLRQDLLDAL